LTVSRTGLFQCSQLFALSYHWLLYSMPLEARVKSVLSGDTVVLSHITNPGQERTLSLAYVSAPRLRREGDEVSYFLLCLP
jgi:hypothetical protein